MTIEWAPLRVPLERRLQTLVTSFFTYTFFTLPISSCLAVAILLVILQGKLVITLMFLLCYYTRENDLNVVNYRRNQYRV